MASIYSIDLEFSSNQYASRSDTASLSITGDITILGYWKFESLPATTGQNAGLVSKGNGTTNFNYSFRVINSGGTPAMDFAYAASGTSFTQKNWTTSSIVTGTWQRFGVSVDVSSQTYTFYLDGTTNAGSTVSTNASSIGDNGDPTYVGLDIFGGIGGGRRFDGRLKDVHIISGLLTGPQMTTIFDNLCAGIPPSGCAAWWTFENTYNDASGNANTLTGVNSPTFVVDSPYACSVTTIKTWNGIARANVKTLDGVASASIKTINGIT